jgi:hypothetical protein
VSACLTYAVTYCLADPDEAEGYPLDQVESMFLRLG